MKKAWTFFLLLPLLSWGQDLDTIELSKQQIKNKIKGGWAGQVIGCTYGGPTEFRYRSKIVPDEVEIPWYDGHLAHTYKHKAGLYDDIYMDLTFVEVFEKEGLDAPAQSFAEAFARAEYPLWHGNQVARYNIQNGLTPPETGHWLHNPHADDLDFQIQADFAGLMSPGMVNTAAEISDKIGHITNYGDGWYGGVYVAALYSLSFVSDDIDWIVEEALKSIPAASLYYKTIRDVIDWYEENPTDWKKTWARTIEKWGFDIGCPNGVFEPFNIDAKINSAWIVMGLLYGRGNFGKTIDIATRCGDDSDCNPASAGGILGTVLGYEGIPDYWKQGLQDVESLDFKYTNISLEDAYEMSTRHALMVLENNGGTIDGDTITIPVQKPEPVRLEVAFEGHIPVKKKLLNLVVEKEASFDFEGIGFTVNGQGRRKRGAGGNEPTELKAEVFIDGEKVETVILPTAFIRSKPTPFWRFQLPRGKHRVRIVVIDPSDIIELYLESAVIYSDAPEEERTGKI